MRDSVLTGVARRGEAKFCIIILLVVHVIVRTLNAIRVGGGGSGDFQRAAAVKQTLIIPEQFARATSHSRRVFARAGVYDVKS